MSAFNLFKNITVLGVAALLLMGTGSIGKAQDKKRIPKRILTIFVHIQGLPWVYHIEESMRDTVVSEFSFPTDTGWLEYR